ncbi:MAG: hypothetical protein H6840_00010 [Planctomycetes bacterium]|nr:hypothetical protein [Planctomycetota bacterium]
MGVVRGLSITLVAALMICVFGCAPKVEPDATQRAYDFVSGRNRAGGYQGLIEDLDRFENIETATGVLMEGGPVDESNDDYAELVCYLADRQQARAVRRLDNIAVSRTNRLNKPTTLLAELRLSGQGSLRDAWNQLRQESHSWQTDDRMVLELQNQQ